MQAAALGNERRPTVCKAVCTVPGLAVTVMLTNVGADGWADQRHEPIDPSMMEPDREAHEESSERL